MSEQKPKHDGNLGDGMAVEHWQQAITGFAPGMKYETTYIQYVRIASGDDVVLLMPNQALSLLAWLEQERDTLERVAKEQT